MEVGGDFLDMLWWDTVCCAPYGEGWQGLLSSHSLVRRLQLLLGEFLCVMFIYFVHEILIVSLLDERDDSSWAFGGAAVVLAFVEKLLALVDGEIWFEREGVANLACQKRRT